MQFFAPWCGHCKALKPAWIEAASELSGKVKVGAVDCTAHQTTCSQFGVRGYPTIKFFGSDKNAEDYQGGRDSGSIVDFATRKWTEQQPPKEVGGGLGRGRFLNFKP
jgi:protein disulfide-isomerase A6